VLQLCTIAPKALSCNPHLMERRRPSISIAYFQQIARSQRSAFWNKLARGLEVEPKPGCQLATTGAESLVELYHERIWVLGGSSANRTLLP
jgi:hypothetical protein